MIWYSCLVPFKRDSAKPFKKTYQCSRFLCLYKNPPQAAAGTYICRAVYAGRPCTGTYEVSDEDAGEYHATWKLRYKEQDEEKEAEVKRMNEDNAREERMRYVRELRRRKDEDNIRKWREERSAYERILSSDDLYDVIDVNERLKAIGKGAIIDYQGQDQQQAQVKWMESRMVELDGMIADLEDLRERDDREVNSDRIMATVSLHPEPCVFKL